MCVHSLCSHPTVVACHQDTRNDHNQMLTRFLNDRLQDEMSVVDLLNYEYQKTPSAEESQEESLEKLEDAEET